MIRPLLCVNNGKKRTHYSTTIIMLLNEWMYIWICWQLCYERFLWMFNEVIWTGLHHETPTHSSLSLSIKLRKVIGFPPPSPPHRPSRQLWCNASWSFLSINFLACILLNKGYIPGEKMTVHREQELGFGSHFLLDTLFPTRSTGIIFVSLWFGEGGGFAGWRTLRMAE